MYRYCLNKTEERYYVCVCLFVAWSCRFRSFRQMWVGVCICIPVYMFTCAHPHTYGCTYMHTHTHTHSPPPPPRSASAGFQILDFLISGSLQDVGFYIPDLQICTPAASGVRFPDLHALSFERFQIFRDLESGNLNSVNFVTATLESRNLGRANLESLPT